MSLTGGGWSPSSVSSLRQIMDEQLAMELHESETIDPIKIESHEDEDYLLALKLSEESGSVQVFDSTNDESYDDFLLALQMQNEADLEHDIRMRTYYERSQYGSKVTVNYDNLLLSGPSHFQPDFSWEADEEESFAIPTEPARNTPKKKARMSRGKFSKNAANFDQSGDDLEYEENEPEEIITKHDAVIASVRNISKIEYSVSVNSGDLARSGVTLNNPVSNQILKVGYLVDRQNKPKPVTPNSDRQTVERVMDKRTKLLLFKMINAGLIRRVEGLISCGKEANVYRVSSAEKENEFYAVKVFKTTLNDFKNRETYIRDDFRFKHRCKKQTSSKFIQVWVEKEAENLKRLKKHGITCPEVILHRKHILIMSYIGGAVKAAPQLRRLQSQISTKQFSSIYLDCIQAMRVMFQKAKLVHGDLSEYNLLYYREKLYFIDVAQSVNNQHPFALYFLRRDCHSINKFFYRQGVRVVSNCELFNYIIDPAVTDENEEQYLTALLTRVASRESLTEQELLDEDVFMNSFIPQHLGEVPDPVGEHARAMAGDTTDIYHQALTGFTKDLSGKRLVPDLLSESLINEVDNEEEDEDEDSDADTELTPESERLFHIDVEEEDDFY